MGSHATVTNVTQTRMAPEIVPYFSKLAREAQNVIASPYQAYGGQRLAGFAQPETAAQQGYAQYGMSGGPTSVGSAKNYLSGAATGLDTLQGTMGTAATKGYAKLGGYGADYTGGKTTANPLGGYATRAQTASDLGVSKMQSIAQGAQDQASMLNTDLNPYMRPYQQNVSTIRERAAREEGRRAMSNLGSQAALGGGYGGYRHGLMENDLRMATQQSMDDIRAKGLEGAYRDAQGMFEADRAAGFTGRDQQMAAQQAAEGLRGFGWQGGIRSLDAEVAAQQAAEAYRQGAMGRQQGAYQGLGGMAGQMAGLGGQEQAMLLERLANLESVGQRQRALTQAGMDVGYGDFSRQVGYPKDQLGWFANILNQLPTQQDVTEREYANQPGLFQSLLGTGVGALGLYNANRNRTG
jgi:hypothetical protein